MKANAKTLVTSCSVCCLFWFIATVVVSAALGSLGTYQKSSGGGMSVVTYTTPLLSDMSSYQTPYQTVTRNDLLEKWHCYLGRSGFVEDTMAFSKPTWGAILNGLLLNRDYFATASQSSDVLTTLRWLITQSPYITEPTHGFQKYTAACNDLHLLLSNRSEHSISVHTTIGLWTSDESHPFVDATTIHNYPVEAPRIESKDVFPIGGLFVLKTNNIPHGEGAWPAFWMLGTTTGEWQDPKWNGMGAASTWPFQGQGEIDFFEYVDGTYATHPFQSNKTMYGLHRYVTLHTPSHCIANISTPIGTPPETLECQGGATPEEFDKLAVIHKTSSAAEYGNKVKGSKNNGCGAKVDMSESPNWLESPMTFVFNYDLHNTTVQSFSFKTNSTTDALINLILNSTSKLSTEEMMMLKMYAGRQSSEHKFSNCDNVFKDMHLILNTALCGDWAGTANEKQCESHVAENFGYNKTVQVKDDNLVQLPYWNIESNVSKQYSWDIEQLSYRAYT